MNYQIEKIALLPCPFCDITPAQPECFIISKNNYGCIFCTNCAATSPIVKVDKTVEDAENLRLREDSARLDWLIDNCSSFILSRGVVLPANSRESIDTARKGNNNTMTQCG